MVKEIEFDGSHGQDGSKKAFAYRRDYNCCLCHAERLISRKFWLPSIRCVPGCGHQITAPEINRVTWDEIKCPKCGMVFDPQRER